MKIGYVVGRSTTSVEIPKKVLSGLPSFVCLFLTAQFLDQQESIIKQVEASGRKVDTVRTRHTAYHGQLYGCSTQRIETKADAFFYVGDGVFHPYALLFDNEQNVHAYNPFTKESHVYTKDNIQDILKKRKAAYTRFLHAESVGVLITTKTGQNRMAFAERLQKKLPDKKVYLFLTETLDFEQLENFPYIDVWVNTMCPRIGLDDTRRTRKAIINMEDISRFIF